MSSTASFSEDESVLYVVWSCFVLVALDRGTGRVLWDVPFRMHGCLPVAYEEGRSLAPIAYNQTFILAGDFSLINVTMVDNSTTAPALTQRSFCTSQKTHPPGTDAGFIGQTPARDRAGGLHFCAVFEMAAMESNGTMRYYKHISGQEESNRACYHGTVLDSAGRPYFVAKDKVGGMARSSLCGGGASFVGQGKEWTTVLLGSHTDARSGDCARPQDGRDALGAEPDHDAEPRRLLRQRRDLRLHAALF